MTNNDVRLVAEFTAKRELYLRLEEEVTKVLERLICENDFLVMDLQHRTKLPQSLEGKIRKKSGKYKSLEDITDLCGFRIICFFSDTVDQIAENLRKNFAVDMRNSVDKRDALEATQFGYVSLHYICSLKDAGELSGIPFEIQIRTVLQHTWAEIEHDLGYKSEFGIPRAIRREFSRIAGLLEIADNQFIALRDNTRAYTESIREKIISGNADDVLLDSMSLNEFMLRNSVMEEFINWIVETTHVSLERIDPEVYLDQLRGLGVETIGDLTQFVNRNGDFTYRVISEKIHQFDLDIISTNMILRYLVRSELIQRNYNENQIREIMSIGIFDQEQVEIQVRRLMREKEKFKESTRNGS